jgi:GNAT superfamily N-acetyltransferase
MQLIPLDVKQRSHLVGAASVWNAACGPDLAITAEFAAHNLRSAGGLDQEGCLAVEGKRVVGFAMVSHLSGLPEVAPEDCGWLDALVVHPDAQRRGVGTALLGWAESWLKKRGVRQAQLGGSIRPFAPSLPEELSAAMPFFVQCGWHWDNRETWDVARDLGDGKPIVRSPMPESSPGDGICTAEVGDRAALEAFLARSFAGRWHTSAVEFLRQGGRVEDFVILRQAGQVQGFAWLTYPDSARPIERVYPQRLPKPWGHLGPLGVAEPLCGLGWGGLLLQSGLMALRARGVRGCVIDWTHLLDFYGKWGFKPYRRYLFIRKTLE